MNFKDALLINEGIILELRTEDYVNLFKKNGLGKMNSINKRYINTEPKFYDNLPYKTIPFYDSKKNYKKIKVGCTSAELYDFINDTLEVAKQKSFNEYDLTNLKQSLNDFKKLIVNYQ